MTVLTGALLILLRCKSIPTKGQTQLNCFRLKPIDWWFFFFPDSKNQGNQPTIHNLSFTISDLTRFLHAKSGITCDFPRVLRILNFWRAKTRQITINGFRTKLMETEIASDVRKIHIVHLHSSKIKSNAKLKCLFAFAGRHLIRGKIVIAGKNL